MKPTGPWVKSDPAVAERFHNALPDHPLVERKKMFGYACGFVNGHFFAGMFQNDMVIRLPNGLRDKFPVLADVPVFNPMGAGKGMTDWYTIPRAVADNPGKLADFLAEAFVEIARLPPKVKTAKKSGSKSPAETKGGKGSAKPAAPKTPAKAKTASQPAAKTGAAKKKRTSA